MCVCWCLEAERNEHQQILRNQEEGKSTQVKFCLGPQDTYLVRLSGPKQSHINVGAMKLRETNQTRC